MNCVLRVWRSELGFATGAALIYLLAAFVFLEYPLLPEWNGKLLGTGWFEPDAVLNAGILEWGYRALTHSAERVFSWPAGYPHSGTLAGTEHLLGWQLAYTPLRALGVGNVAAYDTLLLLTFVVGGLGVSVLGRRLGLSRSGAAVAGFIFAFGPLTLRAIIHIQTLAVCWSPWALYFLDRFFKSRSWLDAGAVAGFTVITVLSGMYFAVFLPPVLAIYSVLGHTTHRFDVTRLAVLRLGLLALASALLFLPIFVQYLAFAKEFGFEDRLAVRIQRSVSLSSLRFVPPWSWLYSGTPLAALPGRGYYSPGIVAVALGLLSASAARKTSRMRPVWIVSIVLAVTALVLSMGPVLKVYDGYPARIAGHNVWLPGGVFELMPGIRMPSRMIAYAALFGSILCGIGYDTVSRRVLSSRRRPGLMLITIAILAAEYRPTPSYVTNSIKLAPPVDVLPGYRVVAALEEPVALAELPLTDTTGFDLPVIARYVYGASGHLKRTAAYHASVRLALPDSIQSAAARLPNAPDHKFLRDAGISHVLIHRALMPVVARPASAAFSANCYEILLDKEAAVLLKLVDEGCYEGL